MKAPNRYLPSYVIAVGSFWVLAGVLATLSGCKKSGYELPKPKTTIFEAARSGNVRELQRHFYHGTDLNQGDDEKNTPLHYAVRARQTKAVKLLIDNGGKAAVKNRAQITPLHLAAASGSVPISELLIEAGAAVNAPDGTNSTPLYIAKRNGHVSLVRLLTSHGGEE